MNTKWFIGTKTAEDRDHVSVIVKNSRTILDLLSEVLAKDLQVLEGTNPNDYNIANWPYWRADRDGQIRAIKNIMTLLKSGDHPNV